MAMGCPNVGPAHPWAALLYRAMKLRPVGSLYKALDLIHVACPTVRLSDPWAAPL